MNTRQATLAQVMGMDQNNLWSHACATRKHLLWLQLCPDCTNQDLADSKWGKNKFQMTFFFFHCCSCLLPMFASMLENMSKDLSFGSALFLVFEQLLPQRRLRRVRDGHYPTQRGTYLLSKAKMFRSKKKSNL